MKKIYFLIVAIVFSSLTTALAVDMTIQVDLNNASDYYQDGAVWIMMDNNWEEYYDMTDENSDLIFEYTVSAEVGSEVYYKFAYQTGEDPWSDYVEEMVPDGCSAENGLRMTIMPDANTTLPAVVYESCYTNGVTMRVDLSEISDLYEGGAVWVYMDDNWEEYYDMIPDGNNIYYYTVQKDEGITMQYSFSYQNGPDPNNDFVYEIVPAECSNEAGYRELLVPVGDTVLPAFLFSSCTEATGAVVPTYTTTFKVDMNDPIIIDLYEGGSVWLNINDWTDYYDMTDPDEDGIYSYEMELDSGSTMLYKFSFQYGPDPDSDYMDEPVPAECSSQTSEWNREYTATMDNVLPAVLMGSCGENGDPGTEKFDVVYSVELDGDSVIENGMWMVTKNPWSWREQMVLIEDVYSSSMKLYAEQTIPYTYVYGGKDNWSGEESVPPACNFGTPEAPERMFEGTVNDSIIPVIPFGECLGGPDPVTITYQVDMTEQNMAEGDVVWTYIWPNDAWPTMVDDDGDGIYALEMSHMPGTEIQYFFAFGTDAIWDEETVPTACSDEEGYRTFLVGENDQVLPSYLYASCEVTGVNEYENSFAIYPNPAKEFVKIELLEAQTNAEITISDVSGRIISMLETQNEKVIVIPTDKFSKGIYFVQLKTPDVIFSKKLVIEN